MGQLCPSGLECVYVQCLEGHFIYCFNPRYSDQQASANSVDPGPEIIKPFSFSTWVNMKFVLLINLKLLTIANSFLLNIAEHENFSAYKYCLHFHFFRENFMLAELNMKKVITSGPAQMNDHALHCLPLFSSIWDTWTDSKIDLFKV